MPRTPLRQLGDMIGMYAYLAATGGLRYWPTIRHASIEEEVMPREPATVPQIEEFFSDSVRYEHSSSREGTPVT